MTAEEFVKKDLGSNIAKGDRLQNIHYTAEEWLDVMEKYAQSKIENLTISDVSSREIEKLNHDIELWKNLYHQRGRIMEKWIAKYNLPIAKAVLDGSKTHER